MFIHDKYKKEIQKCSLFKKLYYLLDIVETFYEHLKIIQKNHSFLQKSVKIYKC